MLSALCSLAVLPLAAHALQAHDARDVQQDGILQLPVRTVKNAAGNLLRRQDNTGLTDRQLASYTLDVTIGTPGQTIPVILDTGSYELWVNPNCALSDDPSYCEQFPQFTESSSLQDLHETGGVNYLIGGVEWEYYDDFVTVGSAQLTQQIFGVATNSTSNTFGIMGVGPGVNGFGEGSYPYIVDSLQMQGFIQSRAFSLDLRSIEAGTGSITFGGIDTGKYKGALEKRPVIPASDAPDNMVRFWIYIDGINVVADGKTSPVLAQTNGEAVVMDSGTTFSYLAPQLTDHIASLVPSASLVADSNGEYSVDCSVAQSAGGIEFVFGDTTVKISFADFIFQMSATECMLGTISNAVLGGSSILGDSFLRAAYVVYDWDNRNVFIAEAADCGSNLVPIGVGPDSVPSLTGDCGASTTTTAPPTTSTTSPPTTTSSPPTTTSSPPTTSSSPPTTMSTKTAPPTSSTYAHYSNTTTTRGGTSSIYSHATTSSASYVTSTVTTSKVYTITSCPPTVTNCPVGSVTTEVIESTTTWCPEAGKTTSAKPVLPTSKCAPTSATWAVPPPGCGVGVTDCHVPTTTATPKPITVCPVTASTTITVVPGCSVCGPPASSSGYALTTAAVPTSPASNYTSPASPPPVTAGSAKAWQVSGVAALIAGMVAVAAL